MPSETATIHQRIELPSSEFIFGSSAGMRDIRKAIESACQDDLPVLIEGESGTGKEVIGRYLHNHSRRSAGPFLKFNCAALPLNLLEEEMFGSGTNPGTDPRLRRRGSIALATGGTLFVDEVGDLDLRIQEKLTKMFQSGCYQNSGGSENLTVDTRLICATSRDLERAVEARALSADFVQQISHHRLRLLPLRERKEDIPQLCEYLLAKFARDFGRSVPRLSSYVLSVFQQWKWPGNIRELENWIARIVIFGTEEAIGLEFNRQLLAWQEPQMRSHRATRVALSRARRLRRHI